MMTRKTDIDLAQEAAAVSKGPTIVLVHSAWADGSRGPVAPHQLTDDVTALDRDV